MRRIAAVVVLCGAVALACSSGLSKLTSSKDKVSATVTKCFVSNSIFVGGMTQSVTVKVENRNSFDVQANVDVLWTGGDYNDPADYMIVATKGTFIGTRSWDIHATTTTAEQKGPQDCTKAIKSVLVVARPT
jgi:hypothetical protein